MKISVEKMKKIKRCPRLLENFDKRSSVRLESEMLLQAKIKTVKMFKSKKSNYWSGKKYKRNSGSPSTNIWIARSSTATVNKRDSFKGKHA